MMGFISFSLRCLLLSLLLVLPSFSIRGEDERSLSEQINEYSRYEGYLIAEDLKERMPWVDLPSVLEGIAISMAGQKMPAKIDADAFYKIFFRQHEIVAEKNLQKATDYLEALSTNVNIHSLENGRVLYEIIEEGQGDAVVQKNGSPLLHYGISTATGEVVENTRKSDSGPLHVPLSETICGFAKGVEGMRKGERRKIFIHPDVGYGKIGPVPPNSLLIIDVQVIDLQ